MTEPVAVAVTGLGAVCALGHDVPSIWQAVASGRQGIAEVEIVPGEHGPSSHRAPLAKLSSEAVAAIDGVCSRDTAAQLDPFARSALYVARAALADAGLEDETLPRDTAVVFGHSTGGTASLEESYARFFGLKSHRVHPLTIPRCMVSSPASAVAMALDIRGPVFAVSSACSSSGHAIVQAAMMIRNGTVGAAIVGGSESTATSGMVRCWQSMQAMSKSTCRPFCGDRDGMVLGEGAAALVLEDAARAKARGAKIYGLLVGEGCTSDALHLTQPSEEGPVEAMKRACQAGGVSAGAPILVSAHGTGTPLNDRNEAAAIKTVFAHHGGDLRVIATKSAHGHLLGASTALQVVIGLLAMHHEVAPPILNHGVADPECDVPLVLGESCHFAPTHLLSNSFAFGGLNVSLLFERDQAGPRLRAAAADQA